MMRSKRPESALSRSTTTTVVATSAAALLIAGLALTTEQFIGSKRALVSELEVQARIIGSSSAAALMFGDHAAAAETLAALQAAPNVLQATLRLPDGNTFAHYPHTGSPDLPGPAGDRDQITVQQPILVDGRAVGSIEASASLRPVRLRLLSYTALLLAVSAMSLGLSLSLVGGLRRRVTQAEAHLEYLAHTDPVTGLPNRHALNERMRERMRDTLRRPGQTLGLLLIDLDDFKVVNDTLGHQTGDQLLEELGRTLRAVAPEADVVCRMGGDEFAILVNHPATQPQLEALAARIVATLAEPLSVDRQELYVSASIGCSSAPQDGVDAETLMRAADTAMYYAKRRGKNACAAFRGDMVERSTLRMQMERDLRRALQRNEFLMLYQPQVRLDDERVIAAEALLRWQHPVYGIIAPDEFIGIAEECGLIVPIGRCALELAIAQAGRWAAQGQHELRIAINVSVRQLRDEGFVDHVQQLLAVHGLAPHQLELEITESMLMDGPEAGIAMLRSLRALGVAIAIDDFGTGYSSLAYLPDLPINMLKIDRSFVARIPGQGAAITTAILALARSFGLQVVAEGVERADQAQFLREAGCRYAQGWLFAPAMSAEDFAAMLPALEPR